jgi:hypothetical protein
MLILQREVKQMLKKKRRLLLMPKSMQRQFYFEALLKVNKTPEIQYFYGIALLENNNIKESEVVLKHYNQEIPFM